MPTISCIDWSCFIVSSISLVSLLCISLSNQILTLLQSHPNISNQIFTIKLASRDSHLLILLQTVDLIKSEMSSIISSIFASFAGNFIDSRSHLITAFLVNLSHYLNLFELVKDRAWNARDIVRLNDSYL